MFTLRTDAKTKTNKQKETYLFKIEGSCEVLHRPLLTGVSANVSREPEEPPLVEEEEEDKDCAAPESSIFSAELAT